MLLAGAGYSLNVMKTAKQFPKTSQDYTTSQVNSQEYTASQVNSQEYTTSQVNSQDYTS